MIKPVFVMRILCTQLSNASKARCRLIEIGKDPAFAGLFTRYYHYMGECLRITNECIGKNGRESFESSLSNIAHLTYVDLYTKGSLWQAHLSGFFAYIQHRVSIATIIREPSLGMDFVNAVLW